MENNDRNRSVPKMGEGGGKKRVSQSTRAGLQFDVGRIAKSLKRGSYADVIARNAPVSLAGVLQYITTEVLQLAGDAARGEQKTRIVPRHIKLGLRKNNELRQLFDVDSLAEDPDALADDPDALSNDADALADNADAISDDADALSDDALHGDVDAIADAGVLPNLKSSLMLENTGGGKVGSSQADAVFEPCSNDVFDPFDAFARDGAPSTALEKKDMFAGGKIQFDWKETLDAHIFKADLPGEMEEEVKIEVEDGRLLQISGVRSKEEEGQKFHLAERARGRFVRRFRLPENAILDQGNASMENGVLTVTVPKQPQ